MKNFFYTNDFLYKEDEEFTVESSSNYPTLQSDLYIETANIVKTTILNYYMNLNIIHSIRINYFDDSTNLKKCFTNLTGVEIDLDNKGCNSLEKATNTAKHIEEIISLPSSSCKVELRGLPDLPYFSILIPKNYAFYVLSIIYMECDMEEIKIPKKYQNSICEKYWKIGKRMVGGQAEIYMAVLLNKLMKGDHVERVLMPFTHSDIINDACIIKLISEYDINKARDMATLLGHHIVLSCKSKDEIKGAVKVEIEVQNIGFGCEIVISNLVTKNFIDYLSRCLPYCF